jgi:hypothetical protein
VAEKNRIKDNPLRSEYGGFVSLNMEKELVLDEDALHRAILGCKNIVDVFAVLPFLSLTENEDVIECEFCPGTHIVYHEPIANQRDR